MEGLRDEEKWRLDRTGAPEGWLRVGRGSHAWRDPRGFGSGESAPSVSPPQSAREVCPALRPGPTPTEASPQPHWSRGVGPTPGEEKEKQAGGDLQERRSRRGTEGVGPNH